MMTTTSMVTSRVGKMFVFVTLAAAFAGCADGRRGSDEDPPLPDVVDMYTFDSLEQMVSTSDLIIVGHVTDMALGRMAGEPGPTGNGDVQFFDATIAVEEVMKGERSTRVSVEVDEISMPFEEGDAGMFFLLERATGPGYLVVSSTGVFLYEGDRIVSSNAEYAWTAQAELQTRQELESVVRSSVADPVSPAAPYGARG